MHCLRMIESNANSGDGEGKQPRPEFIRLPRPGALCPWSSISRSKMNQLILPNPLNNFRPQVQSFSLRNRGQLKGTRLIVLDSLLAYLHGLRKEQNSEVAQ